MSKFGHSIKHLVREMIPPAIFFFVTFQLLAFTRALMLKRYGIEVGMFVVATIGALVAAKVVVLADLLPFINRFPGRPIIWNIAWKLPIYFLAAFVVHYLEELFDCYRKTGDLAAANHQLLDDVVWTRFCAIQIWLMVLLLVYCTMQELARALGPGKMRELFLGASSKAEPSSRLDHSTIEKAPTRIPKN
jgi:hypothetical protein